jgi:hypothetical protein
MNPKVFFVCYPDTDHPIGGVKQIYRQVELLCHCGIEAKVLHETSGFRVSWFNSDAPVIDIDSYIKAGPIAETDLIVLPETWVSNIPTYLAGIKKVIFNQNAYYTFGLEGKFDSSILSFYQHPDVLGVVTVSRDNRNFLVNGCGLADSFVHSVINGIDCRLFYPPEVKVRRVVFFERKHFNHANTVALMARQRDVLRQYEFKSLGKIPHQQVASELREALVFLSCGHPEGFGLPLAEAIACGCIPVGYHGLAGRDFCSQALHHVEFGDLLGFVDTLEQAVLEFEANPQVISTDLLRNADHLLRQYSFEREKQICLDVWQHLINCLSSSN